MNKLNFTASIPVLSGDTIGYRLQPVAQGTEMHFLLDNSNASLGVEILTRSTSEVVCQLSPCDSLYTTRADSAPLISVEFGEYIFNVSLSDKMPYHSRPHTSRMMMLCTMPILS